MSGALQIHWTGALHDCGHQCGIGGKIPGSNVQMAIQLGRTAELTPNKVIDAAWKIEFAICSQLEAAGKSTEAQITRADTTPARK